ncbi:MAG: beta-N-acetylhexosaminidase, partial [Oscillospiraceae bacterium]
PRIAVNLRKIDIPAWVLAGNYEDDAHFREKFQQWVDQLWTEKDQLIEKMIASVRQGYRTNLIHVGMDEAMNLGLGNYLKENGYENGFSIMQKHIAKVTKIAQSHGFRPMMWSDMYFRCASPDHNYYEDEIEIPQDVIDNAPDNIDLVYWDYYHHDEAFYDRYIKLHQKFKAKTIFAGGMWTWIGPAIDYDLFFSTSIPGLNACVDNHIKDVMITAWGDDGAETNFLTTLLGIQTYAEYSYKGGFNLEQIKSRFEFCVKADANAFLDIAKFNKTPLLDSKSDIPNPAKFLLYQDPFIGLFDKDIEGLGFCEHYESLVEVFQKHKENNADFRLLFEFYEKLANALQYKSELGLKMMTAYRNKDDEGLRFILAATLPCCKVAIVELKDVWRKLWFSTNKAFGFELLDLKLGGMIARVESAELRLTQYLSKEISAIEEYDEDRLYLLRQENTNILNGMYFWRTLISSSKI